MLRTPALAQEQAGVPKIGLMIQEPESLVAPSEAIQNSVFRKGQLERPFFD